MTSTDLDLVQFARLVDALEPWLDRVLFIGGWAHRLFRERPEAARLSYAPLRTGDVDVALDPRALDRDAGIRERLAASGFREEFLGDDRPPVTHYSLGEEASGFYVEFLSPLLGGDRHRDGSRDVTERIAGVTAQKLRYLDILLVEPWTVTIGEEQGVPLGRPAELLIPHPASFVVQKLLISPRRRREDRAKDALYVHDTIELFAADLEALHAIFLERIAPTLSRSARLALRRETAAYDEVTDLTREAALIAGFRGLTPQAIQEVCQAGLRRLIDGG
jgi:hypothetical protein